MSPKPRRKENKGLPKRWRFRAGKYRYQVPKGQEHLWDGKKEFTLGATLPEAHRTWADRIETAPAVHTISDLLDRYEIEVMSKKKASTRAGQIRKLPKIRAVFGQMRLQDIKPSHVYTYYDKRSAKTSAKREIEILRHALSSAVRWGLLDRNPLLGELRLETERKSQAYVTDDQVLMLLNLKAERKREKGVRVIQGYIKLKLLTGLRRTDLLRLQLADLGEEGILVQTSKTGADILIEWTDALREAVAECKAARPIDISPWLFCTARGKPYIKEDASANGFESLWQRVMAKAEEVAAANQVDFQRFPERALRNKLATDAESLQRAQELLAHASSTTTARWYRLKPKKVRPLK